MGALRRKLACLAITICILALPQGGWATTATWIGATTTNYNTLANWAGTPASIPGTGSAETAIFTDTGVGAVGISAATTNAVGFLFSNTAGNNYTITVATRVNQALTGVTTTGAGNVTLARTGNGTYILILSASTFDIGAGQTTTVSGVITGAGGIDKTSTGTLTLSRANAYTGTTTLTSGTLVAGTNTALGTGALSMGGGTLQAGGAGARTLANNVTVGADFAVSGTNNLTLSGTVGLGAATRTLTVTNTANTTLSGIISNGGLSLNNTGGGTLTLSGVNTYASGTTLTAGTLAAGHANAFGTGGLTINGGTLQAATGTTVTVANAVTMGGAFAIGGANGDNLTLTSGIANGGALLTVNGLGNTTLSGIISGTGGITQVGGATGSLNLSGTNTYTGTTTLTSGTLVAGTNTALGTGALSMGGGTLQASGAARTLANNVTVGADFAVSGTNNLTLSGTVGLGAATRTLTVSNTGNTTLSGVISSTGAFGLNINNTGGGTVTLSNANTFTGTATLTAGTVVAANDTALGAGALSMGGGTLQAGGAGARTVANATTLTANSTITGVTTNDLTLNNTINLNANTLTVNGAGNVTLSNVISGAGGGLTLNSTGTLYLSGTNTYTGATTVTAGNLNLSGSITGNLTNSSTLTVNGNVTGNVINNAGATLGGTGIITGNLTNNAGGTINPGNSPGTLNVVGTFTNAPGATLVAEVASPSSYDRVNVTGNAIITGSTLSPRLLGGYLPSINTVFPGIIQTTTGVAGTFTIDNTRVGNSRTLFWQANYYATSVDLQAVGNYTPADLSLSRNQRSVGNVLNALAPSVTSGDLLTVFDAINALTTNEGVQGAYNEISPQKYAALPTLAFPVTNMQFQYLQNRLARQRWEAELGSDVVSTGGGGFMKGFSFGYDNKMLLAASNMTLSDAGNPLIRRGAEHRWGIYLEPMANWGNLRPTANMVGYRYKNFGFTLGADYYVMDNLLVGLNTGYSKTLTGIGGTGGDINADIIPFNAYTAFFLQGFYVNGTLGYTLSNYDMERNVAFGTINRTAKANTSGNQFQVAAETGYDIKVGKAIVGPTVSLQYATQTTGGFTESNAGALNLKVGSQTADSLQTGVGARASYKAKVGNVTVKPQLAVVWQHEFSNDTRGVNARLAQGSGTMNFRTDKIGQDFAVVSFDLPARVTKNLVAHVGYTAEVARSKSSNQGVNLGLKYEF